MKLEDEAVNTISKSVIGAVNKSIVAAPFDRIVDAKIKTVLDTDYYTVTFRGGDYNLYATGHPPYDVNDSVKIVIPENDYNRMFILLQDDIALLSGITMQGDLDVRGHDLKNNVVITSENGNDYATYPLGFSYSQIHGNNYQQNTGEDFLIAYATLFSVKEGSARFFQVLVRHHEYMEIAVRQYYQMQDGFQPWTRIPTTAVKKLWGTGSWTSGYIDVPGIERYHLLGFKLYGSSAMIVAFRRDLETAPIYGGVFYPNADDRVMTKYLSISVDGNRLTRNRVFSMYHYASGDHSEVTDRAIEEVWGIL